MHQEEIIKGIKRETVDAYKRRLRRTAYNLPEKVIRKALLSMKQRAAAVVEADGDNISMD